MKKLIISLLLLLPLLTACTNIDTRLTINKDKSASIVTSLTYKGNIANGADITSRNILANYEKFLDDMYKVDNSYSQNLSTITATKSVKNIQKEDLDLSSLGLESNLPDGKFVEVKKNFIITSYNIDSTFDYDKVKNDMMLTQGLSSNNQNTGGIDAEYYHKYSDKSEFVSQSDIENSEFDMAANLDDSAKQLASEDAQKAEVDSSSKEDDDIVNTSFSIKLPAFASYNNADSSNAFVYTWKIKQNEPTVIKLQYVDYSGFAITLIILAGILFLVVLSKKILKRDTQKRIDNIENIV